jgi:hypothetical protein
MELDRWQMARGYKTGGRQKGSKNKRTLLIENNTRQLLDHAGQILGEGAFEGDAHALLVQIYKNTHLPLELRLHAAKAAIRFEKPALAPVDSRGTFENVHYVVSDTPMTIEEWAEKHCGTLMEEPAKEPSPR